MDSGADCCCDCCPYEDDEFTSSRKKMNSPRSVIARRSTHWRSMHGRDRGPARREVRSIPPAATVPQAELPLARSMRNSVSRESAFGMATTPTRHLVLGTAGKVVASPSANTRWPGAIVGRAVTFGGVLSWRVRDGLNSEYLINGCVQMYTFHHLSLRLFEVCGEPLLQDFISFIDWLRPRSILTDHVQSIQQDTSANAFGFPSLSHGSAHVCFCDDRWTSRRRR
jgi:hypothetical protein